MTLVKTKVEMNTRTVPNMAPLMEADGFILAFGTRIMIKKKTRKTIAN